MSPVVKGGGAWRAYLAPGLYGSSVFCVENEKVCKKIGSNLPEQDIIQVSARFIHKVIGHKESVSIKQYIGRPSRSTSKIFHNNPKKKTYRMALKHHICLYNQLPQSIKYLKPKTFVSKLKKIEIEYKPPD